jgi:hypothetical protein
VEKSINPKIVINMPNEVSKIELKKITTRVRPPRIVTFINVNDPDWPDVCDRVIERYSQLWGGSYNLIVPTDGKAIDDVFWHLMDIYDPDYLGRYIKTFKDLKTSQPEKFLEIRNGQIEKWLSEHPDAVRADTERMFDEMFDREADSIDNFDISSELKAELIKRLNPFYYDIETGIHYSRIDDGAQHNESSVLPVFNQQGKSKIEDYDVSALAKSLQLYIRSYVGNSRSFFKNLEIKARPFDIPKKKPAVELSTKTVSDQSLQEMTTIINEKKQNIDYSPYWYTNFGLARYTKNWGGFDKDIIVVIGDEIKDFCLFYNLSRIQNEIYWIPKIVIDQVGQNKNYKWFLSDQVLSIRRSLEQSIGKNNSVILTSSSLTAQQLEESKIIIANNQMVIVSGESKIDWLVETPLKVTEHIKKPLVAYESGNANNLYIEQFIDKNGVNLLKTPKPTSFSELNIFENRWISEVDIGSDIDDTISGYLLPKKACFSPNIFDGIKNYTNDTSAIRFSNDCISFYCPTFGLISYGNTMDEILVRPRLHLLYEMEIFGLLFKDLGYEIRLSDKGRYETAAINMFGSLNLLANEFKKMPVVKALDSFVDPKEGQDRLDNNIPGCNLNERSYLNFNDFVSIIGDNKKARDMVDEYLQKGILLRGVALQCEDCREADWYDVKELDQSFICHRCYKKQIYKEKHWRGNGEELPFYYKLNEMVYQGHKNNMIVPILALYQLSKLSKRSFIFVSEIELWKIGDKKGERPDIEIDTACIIDGAIYLGEAKINSDVPAKLDSLNKIVEDLGGRFVYSTLTDKLSPAVETALSTLKWSKPPIFQTKENLLM